MQGKLSLVSCVIDFDRHLVLGPEEGRETSLTPTEVALLDCLIRHGGRPVDRATLLREVWGSAAGRNPLKVSIFRLRQKIEVDPKEPTMLLSVAGSGYRLALAEPVPSEVSVPVALVGRQALLDTLSGAIANGRLVTLRGIAGVGKTAIARTLAGDRADGSYIDLTLGVPSELPDRGLLVLDHADPHLAELSPLLLNWLSANPRRHALVVSRRGLGLEGERVIDVPPLSLSGAVELFQTCARAARPALELDTRTRVLIRRIVEGLDGIPAAIVDAARTLTDADVALADLVRDDTASGVVSRALEQSWASIDPEARSVLRDLLIFDGGFDLTTASLTLARPAADVAGMLKTLLASGFLQSTTGSATHRRFTVLHRVRAFALEQGDVPDAVRRRFASVFGGLETAPFQTIRREEENLRHAHGVAVDVGDGAAAVGCCAALIQGMAEDGIGHGALAMIEQTAAMPLDPPTRARVGLVRARWELSQGRPDTARLALGTAPENPADRIAYTRILADLSPAEALPIAEDLVARASGDVLGKVLLVLGVAQANDGRTYQALDTLENALEHLAPGLDAAQAHLVLARVHEAMGSPGEAERALEVGVGLLRELGARRSLERAERDLALLRAHASPGD